MVGRLPISALPRYLFLTSHNILTSIIIIMIFVQNIGLKNSIHIGKVILSRSFLFYYIMKKKFLIIVCALTIFLCNIRDIHAAVSSDVTRTSFGSYTFESFDATLTIPYFNITLPSGARGIVMIYNFDTTYSGTAEFIFNYVIKPYDWYLYSFGGTCNFLQGSTDYRMHMQFEECSGFGVVIVGASGSPANQLVLDPNYNTVYNLTAVDTIHEDLEQLYTLIDTRCGNVETYLSTISANLTSVKELLDNLQDNNDGIQYPLTTLINSINSLVSNTDQLEGYTDNIESYLNTIAINTGIQNGMSLIQGIAELIGLLSSSIQGGPSLFDVIDGILDAANGIQNLFDNADIDNSDVIAAINNLQSMQFAVYDIQMPYYQYLFFSMLTRSNMSLIKYDESNVPYVQWGDIKNLNLTVTCNGFLTLAYYVNNNQNNRILLDGGSGVNTRAGIATNTRYGNLSQFNLNGTYTISFLNINTQVAPPDSTRIYPLYMGYDHIPEEVALLFPGVDSSSSINKNVQTVQNLLTNILNYLINLELENDDSELISAIDTLTLAISQMNQDITVTNNVSVNSHDLPFYQYLFLSMLIRNNYSKVNFDESGAPYVLWGDIKNNSFTFNAGTGTNKVLISYLSTDANLTMKINNQNITRYRGFGTSSKYNSYYYGDYSFGNQTVTFSTTSNNGVITDTTRIYPVYMGLYDYVPEDVSTILGIYPANTDYSEVLDDILDSLNSLDLNISYNVSNEQIYDITNDFDTNIEIVNNVEVDFNTSFESSNNNITSSDLTINLQPYSESISLYHNLFSSIYNIPLFKFVVIICMVGGVVLVLLG